MEFHATRPSPRRWAGMSNYTTKAEREAEVRKNLAGVSKHITKNVVLNGTSVSAKDIANVLQSTISADDVCDALRLKLAEALKSARTAQTSAKAMKKALKQYVIAHFGESSPVLADFGFSPRKLAQKTVAEKYVAVEKQLATRAARHTMGSRQKAAIHGQVESPAPQAQPAPAQPAAAPPAVNGTTNGTTQAVLSLNGNGH